jgi:catechol 2,3-dioxygenase-like lactoylglutathione lyase family enzyme
MSKPAKLELAIALLTATGLAAPLAAQPTLAARAAAEPTVVRGIYNWVHSTADAERAFPFYRDVLGIELARSPFAGSAPANAAPERIRPLADAIGDPLIWDLTDTKGSRARTVFMRAPNTPFGLELSEFADIARDTRRPNPWDPGASMLIFAVRALDEVVEKLTARGTPVVTLGGTPVSTRAGRSILVRDPDGYLIEVRQASPGEVAGAQSPHQVVTTSIGLTVADTATALRFYQGLLGFTVRATWHANEDERRLHGLAGGEIEQTAMLIPGTAESVILSEFNLAAADSPNRGAQSELATGTRFVANPFRWRIQDVGAPQFQLEVDGLDALIEQTREAGYRFLSVDAKPIQRPFGRFVFAIDPDSVLVEFAEPNGDRNGRRGRR